MKKPFCYTLYFPNLNKKHIGLKVSDGFDSDDLLVKYFTSSQDVKRMIKNGEPVLVSEIIHFDDKSSAADYEYEKLLEVIDDDQWINKTAIRFPAERQYPKRRIRYSKPGQPNYKQSLIKTERTRSSRR